jgi:hypothetical protein
MYIKIKYIKQLLLLAACFFLAGFNYLTYAQQATSNPTKNTVCDKTIDSDCDGLTNAEEKLYGTNPNNIDTDNDSYSDNIEIESGYDPLKPAPGDRIVVANNTTTSNQSETLIDTAPTLTDVFSQSITDLVKAKGNEPISTDDINTLMDEQLSQNMGAPITFDTLPEVDISQIKVLEQNYSKLNDADKKIKESEDAKKYLEQMIYLLLNNAPTTITTTEDLANFQTDFFSHLDDLSATKNDSEYFSDLGNRLELFLNQVIEVEVPETMLELHTKILRLGKGILTLREASEYSDADPMSKILFFSKVNGYLKLFSDFFQNDFSNYFKTLE